MISHKMVRCLMRYRDVIKRDKNHRIKLSNVRVC